MWKKGKGNFRFWFDFKNGRQYNTNGKRLRKIITSALNNFLALLIILFYPSLQPFVVHFKFFFCRKQKRTN